MVVNDELRRIWKEAVVASFILYSFHLFGGITNFVEVLWRSVFRITSIGKRSTSYNAPPTSQKRKRSNKVSPRTFQTALAVGPPS
jgi:hypothetical protein